MTEHVFEFEYGHFDREGFVLSRIVEAGGWVEGIAEDARGVAGATVSFAEDVDFAWRILLSCKFSFSCFVEC